MIVHERDSRTGCPFAYVFTNQSNVSLHFTEVLSQVKQIQVHFNQDWHMYMFYYSLSVTEITQKHNIGRLVAKMPA